MSQCQNFNHTRPPNPFFHYMSRNDEIEDFDFQDIFLALDRHIRYKIYSTSDSEASVPSSSSSITSARAACLLLTLRVSRTGSKIASFRSRGPAGPSSHHFFGQNMSSRCESYHPVRVIKLEQAKKYHRRWR